MPAQAGKSIGPWSTFQLVLESYALQYPRFDPLCNRYKSAVYAGEKRVEKLDPYLLLYEKVEEHLQASGDHERLALARRCLYFKADKSLHQLRKKVDWRCELLAELTERWGWSDDELTVLDARTSWKVDRTLVERKALVNALTYSYKLLSLFAREHASSVSLSERDMTILGRKLFTAFEHKAGKIDIVNHGVSQDLSESHLLLQRVVPTEGLDYWLLYRDVRSLEEAKSQAAPLKRGRTVMELVAWCHFNGLVTSNSRVILEDVAGNLSGRDVEMINDHLHKHFPPAAAARVDIEALGNGARLLLAGVFVNFGSEPLPKHFQKGNILTSNRSDALSFSGWHENLVSEIDYLVVTTWGEILIHKFTGMNGLIVCLCEHLSWLARGTSAKDRPSVSHCSPPRYGETISKRLAVLFESIEGWFLDSKPNWRRRYVVRGGNEYHCLLEEAGAPAHDFSGSYPDLLQHLEIPNAKFTQTINP